VLRNARVTTLGPPDGWTVQEHLGVVTAHVVAGTGFLSDFVAGLTDFFGGRSGTYQRQLAVIESEAVNQIWLQAVRRGANWVVGVRLDFDQLSGKNMQMLMVSALGTAILARQASDSAVNQVKDPAFPWGALRSRVERQELLEHIHAGRLRLDKDTWGALSEHRIADAVPAVVRSVQQDPDPELRKRALEFFQCIPLPTLQHRLHQLIIDSPDLESTAIGFIVGLSAVDLPWVDTQLVSADERLRLAALRLLGGYAPFYSRPDLEIIESIRARLPVAFPEQAKIVESRGILSRTARQRWLCACGGGNELARPRCITCGRDKRGFPEGQFTPEEAEEVLRQQAVCLRALIDDGSEPDA
jgi:uncharacterized protein YbjQ (UPF0145 family)